MRQNWRNFGDRWDTRDEEEGWGKDGGEGLGLYKMQTLSLHWSRRNAQEQGRVGKDEGLSRDHPGLWDLKETRTNVMGETHKQHLHTQNTPSHSGKHGLWAAALILWSKVSFSPLPNQNIFLLVLPPHEGLKILMLSAKNVGSLPSSLPNQFPFIFRSQFKHHFWEGLLSSPKMRSDPLAVHSRYSSSVVIFTLLISHLFV